MAFSSRTGEFVVTAARERGAEYIPAGDRLLFPERFHAAVDPDDAKLPRCLLGFAVERGRPVCTYIRCERREGGAPINGEVLRRFPVATLLREATRIVAHRLVTDPDGGGVRSVSAWGPGGERSPAEWRDDGTPVFGPGDPAPPEERFDALYAQVTAAPRRRGPLKTNELRDIAATYRDAVAAGRPPTQAVSARFGVARSTAGRWVAEARRRGLLGKARPRMAGEINDNREET